jgi:hypothetical protein
MGNVTVYRVELYDVAADAPKISGRWMTRQGAETMRGTVLEDTAVEIDDAELEHGKQWTEIDFQPQQDSSEKIPTFQTVVRRYPPEV